MYFGSQTRGSRAFRNPWFVASSDQISIERIVDGSKPSACSSFIVLIIRKDTTDNVRHFAVHIL